MHPSPELAGAEKNPVSVIYDRYLLLFFVLAFAIGWAPILLLEHIAAESKIENWIALSRMAEAMDFGDTPLSVPGWSLYLITRVQDFAFSISGLIVVALLHGRSGVQDLFQRVVRWKVGWKWYLFGFLPFGLYALSTLVSGQWNSFVFGPEVLFRILFSAEAGFLVYFFFRGAMGEEIGLRGFAVPRLQQTGSAFRASLIIGILWAVWHLPVLIDKNLFSIFAFLTLAFVLSFVFTWLYNGSGGSLLIPMLFHAAQNSEEIFETLFPGLLGTNWELVSSLGLLLLGITVGVLLYRRGSRLDLEKPALRTPVPR